MYKKSQGQGTPVTLSTNGRGGGAKITFSAFRAPWAPLGRSGGVLGRVRNASESLFERLSAQNVVEDGSEERLETISDRFGTPRT